MEKNPINGTDSDATDSNLTKLPVDIKRPETLDPKAATQGQRPTVKHQDSNEQAQPRSKLPRRPQENRRMSTSSVRSRYSKMTEEYFEGDLATYNMLAG
jgi:hypothetical protein